MDEVLTLQENLGKADKKISTIQRIVTVERTGWVVEEGKQCIRNNSSVDEKDIWKLKRFKYFYRHESWIPISINHPIWHEYSTQGNIWQIQKPQEMELRY